MIIAQRGLLVSKHSSVYLTDKTSKAKNSFLSLSLSLSCSTPLFLSSFPSLETRDGTQSLGQIFYPSITEKYGDPYFIIMDGWMEAKKKGDVGENLTSLLGCPLCKKPCLDLNQSPRPHLFVHISVFCGCSCLWLTAVWNIPWKISEEQSSDLLQHPVIILFYH